MTDDLIYLDHAAATPMRPAAILAMRTVCEESFGNPSSAHSWGRIARGLVEDARDRIASHLGTTPAEIRFVRGGTESVNLAVLGAARAALRGEAGTVAKTVYQSSVEHSCVRGATAEAASEGLELREMQVSPKGAVDLPDTDDLGRGSVALVTAQRVNQETGLQLDLAPLAGACAYHGVPLHVDAVQAFGKIPLSIGDIPASLVSVSAHKIGGPRGMGALFVRRGTPLHPLMFGGSQENELRPGTEDVAGIVGFAAAVEAAMGDLAAEGERLRVLRDDLEARLVDALPDIQVRSAEGERAPHILNVGIPGVARDILVGALDLEGVGASAGSACQSGAVRVSWVVEALYGPAAAQVAPLRLSVGWTTTPDEIRRAAEIVARVVERARTHAVPSGFSA